MVSLAIIDEKSHCHTMQISASKHGPSECLGDIQELCFKHVHPDQRDWFAFDLCLNEHYEDIGNDKQLAHDCGKRMNVQCSNENS